MEKKEIVHFLKFTEHPCSRKRLVPSTLSKSRKDLKPLPSASTHKYSTGKLKKFKCFLQECARICGTQRFIFFSICQFFFQIILFPDPQFFSWPSLSNKIKYSTNVGGLALEQLCRIRSETRTACKCRRRRSGILIGVVFAFSSSAFTLVIFATVLWDILMIGMGFHQSIYHEFSVVCSYQKVNFMKYIMPFS